MRWKNPPDRRERGRPSGAKTVDWKGELDKTKNKPKHWALIRTFETAGTCASTTRCLRHDRKYEVFEVQAHEKELYARYIGRK